MDILMLHCHPSASSRLSALARLALTGLLTLTISACATRQPAPETTLWEPHQRVLLELRHWQLDGKMGYRSPGQNGSAFIRWQQQDDAFSLVLTGPFGSGATRIEGNQDIAVLSQSGKEDIVAPTASELTQWLFGWELPVNQMVEWVKGVPAPEPAHQQMHFNLAGQLEQLAQNGWQLDFDRFQQVDQWVLPGRIRGKHGDVSFTLVINKWLPDHAVQGQSQTRPE